MGIIFGTYDQAALDREYDNRAKVGERLQSHLDFFATESLRLRASVPFIPNLSYGASGAETLDICRAPDGQAQPVQVFIHGGYWKALDAKDFSYVARAFRPRGVLTVVVNYGLMPGISMAEQIAQIARAIAWVHHNIAGYGGDPQRVFISGHSAGGHLAAMMLVTDWAALGVSGIPLRGVVGISGLYDLRPVQKCFVNQDLGLSDADVAAFSPVACKPALGRSWAPPVLAPVGADEGPEYLRQSHDLAAAWQAHGLEARDLPMAGLNHFTIIQQLNDPRSDLTNIICRQMAL